MNIIKQLFIVIVLWSGTTSAKILPLKDFTKPADFKTVSISPDGKKLAGVVELDGMDKVAVIDLEKMKPLSAKSFGENRRVSNITWANDNLVLMSVQKQVGNLDRKAKWDGIYAMRFDGKNSKAIFVFDPKGGGLKGHTYGVSILDGLVDDPKNILIQELTKSGVHTFKYNLKSGKRKSFSEPADKHAGAPALNSKYQPIVATAFDSDTESSYLYYKKGDSSNWKKLDLAGNKTEVTLAYGGSSKDLNYAYILSNYDAPTIGLFKLNLNSGELKKIYRNDKVDIITNIVNQNNESIGFFMVPDYPTVIWVDKKDPITQIYKGLKQSFQGENIRILNYTRDNKIMLFGVSSDKNPGAFYLLDLEKNKIKSLVNNRGWVNPKEMAAMKPITYKARDGVEMHGYITYPPGKDPKDLPLIVHPHGGPHGIRDYWGYDPEVQMYANRGYAVLQVNFRGSGGYGIDFLKSGYGKWGREMQDDLTDGTLWAIEQGIADKDRICLAGASYGGYATLQGLVREPDLYKCGFGYVGVYDLIKMRTCSDTVSKGGSRGKDFLNKAVGKDSEKLKLISPAYNTDKIKAKVFLAHGEDDVRVPMCQLNSLVKGLKANGVDYEVMTRDEGHGYQNPQNKLDLYKKVLSFLDKSIGH